MSRSYKHTPIAKDSDKKMVNVANRWLRRNKEITPSKSQFKKHGVNQYSICDWVFYGGTWKSDNWEKLFVRK